MHVGSELSDILLSIVFIPLSNNSSVYSDDISESLDDWKVLEFVGIHDNLGEFSFGIVGWVNNFKGAHEQFFLIVFSDKLIWEAGINDNTIEVEFLVRGEFNFTDFSVVVFAGSLGWASSLLSGGSWWHFFS